jgi:hypothetical protein
MKAVAVAIYFGPMDRLTWTNGVLLRAVVAAEKLHDLCVLLDRRG